MRPTIAQMLTAIVALTVIIAVAVPLWRSHELRTRRAEAIESLEALQQAQDRYFGTHARYADTDVLHAAPPQGLGIARQSREGHYSVELTRSADALGYVATARARPGDRADTRCVELRLDQLDRRQATDETGADTSADCWSAR